MKDLLTDQEYAQFLERHKTLIEKQRSEIADLPRGEYRRNRQQKLKWLIRLHRRHIAELNPAIFFEHTGVRLRSLRVRER